VAQNHPEAAPEADADPDKNATAPAPERSFYSPVGWRSCGLN